MFHRCKVYVDIYTKAGNPATLIKHSPLVISASKVRMYGGQVYDEIRTGVTHIVIDDTKYNHLGGRKAHGELSFKKGALKALRVLRNLGSNVTPKFVTPKWVQDSVVLKSVQEEEKYAPTWWREEKQNAARN